MVFLRCCKAKGANVFWPATRFELCMCRVEDKRLAERSIVADCMIACIDDVLL